MNDQLKQLIQELNTGIKALNYGEKPTELYAPIRYLMEMKGKRLRPLLVLMAYRLFKEDHGSAVLPSLTVEVFHNFTLMHDDIMDEAPIRRGQPTVHTKWDDNTAILSGDVMLVYAYRLLSSVPATKLSILLQKFNDCAAEVCEGQQHDMNFEQQEIVSEDAYIEMIRQKTAVLLGFSMEMGAIMAGATNEQSNTLRQIGEQVGIGFQLKDDLLDVYGQQDKFGKQIGGDIIANKKTYLLINALNLAEGENLNTLQHWLSLESFDKEEKVRKITEIYDKLQIKTKAQEKMQSYFDNALKMINDLDVLLMDQKRLLTDFLVYLIDREQ